MPSPPLIEQWLADDLRRPPKQRQAGMVAGEGSGIIRLEWDSQGLTLSARGEEIGEVTTRVRTMEQGGVLSPLKDDAGRIAFNAKYLAQYLKGKYQPVTIMASQGTSGPALFTSPGAPQVVIMPMFVRWQGEPDPGEAEAPENGDEGAPEGDVPAVGEGDTEEEGAKPQPKGRRNGRPHR